MNNNAKSWRIHLLMMKLTSRDWCKSNQTPSYDIYGKERLAHNICLIFVWKRIDTINWAYGLNFNVYQCGQWEITTTVNTSWMPITWRLNNSDFNNGDWCPEKLCLLVWTRDLISLMRFWQTNQFEFVLILVDQLTWVIICTVLKT